MLRIRAAYPIFLSLFFFGSSAAEESRYLTGGAEHSLPPALQEKLNQHAEIITLGINADWLYNGQIAAEPFVEAVTLIAGAVEDEIIPGATISVDRLTPSTMSVSVGYLMTDAIKAKGRYDLIYDLRDLTGPVITGQIALGALGQGDLALEDTVSKWLPEFADTALGAKTIENLLRHQSGLPAELPNTDQIETREDVMAALAGLPLSPELETSPLNYLVVGFILEKVYEQPLSEIARESLQMDVLLPNSGFEMPPGWRARIAPGAYNEWLGRLEWAEPGDPASTALYPNTPHTNFYASAEDLNHYGKALLVNYTAAVAAGSPPGWVDGEDGLGIGYMVGKYGENSFGWDGDWGRSFWVLPQHQATVVFLTNAEHPGGIDLRALELRDKVMALLVQSLEEGASIDTTGSNPEPSSGAAEEDAASRIHDQ